MNVKYNCIGIMMEYMMTIVKGGHSFLTRVIASFLLMFSLTPIQLPAQDSFLDDKSVSSFAYDEIPVLFIVEGYQSFYVDAIYANDELLYVNISSLFQALNISCEMGQKGDSLGGFIENETRAYLVDFKSGTIQVGDEIYNSGNRIVKEMGSLFMESSLFDEVFGISLSFNFRALTVILKSDFELPVIKQQRIEKMRSNMGKIKGEEVADTIVSRNYHMLRFGMVDWMLGSYQTWDGPTENRFGLGIGTELFHGEANVSVLYYDRKKFDSRQLYYLWRWVDNNKKLIKQAQLGRISNQTISFIGAPVIGGTIRNSPTTVRKATGYYTIDEFTEPNWTVELYINNVLVDYTRADALGSFVFKVPNTYGYTTVKLKFYGPMGEERIEERTMNIPYTIMPAREIEYGISGGIIQDDNQSRFGKGEVNYGVSRVLTLGGGLEYLSSIPNGSLIPFTRATMQPYSNMTITGEYAHGVKTRGLLNYYFWKNALLEIDITKFVDGQLATRFNAQKERKVKLSIPFRVKTLRGFSRFEFAQFKYEGFTYNVTNTIISAYYKQFGASSSAQINWIDNKAPFAMADISLSYRPGKGYTLRPSAQYNLSENKFMTIKAAIEKSIPNGYLTVAYERYVLSDDHFISLNFRFDLSFARTSISAARSNDRIYTSQSAQGSLAFGTGNRHVLPGKNSSLSKGGISIYPFLDLNQNGLFDKGEHMVKLTSVRVMGSKAIFSEKDSIVRIPDLNAFTNCIIEFSDSDLDNIAWRFMHKRYQVLIDPNQFKRIDIPIISVGEASGTIFMNKDNELNGIGRILVKFYQKNSTKLAAETLSESEGYINYLGLEPGEYVARIDSAQLSNLDYNAEPHQIDFVIKSSEEGDIVEGLDFVLNFNETAPVPIIDSLPPVILTGDVDLSDLNMHDTEVDGNTNICTLPGKYYVQCGAFRYKNNALKMASELVQKTDVSVGIIFIGELYKVQVGCVTTWLEADEIKTDLIEKGVFDDIFFKQRN